MSVNTDSLKSMCELIVDCPHSTPKWTDEGIIVLRNQNIKNGILNLSTPSYTNEEDYQKRIKRAVPQAGDIIFTREAPMGEVCLIPEGLKCCLGQCQVLLRPKNSVSGKYLFWALQSPFVKHQILWNEGTGSTVSNVRIPVLMALNIPRHPDKENEIAEVLSILADKIELNHQTNQTLEQIAQAIFKSWFVDFEPVKAKIQAKHTLTPTLSLSEKEFIVERAAMCAISGKSLEELEQLSPETQQQLKISTALFPDALVESELGEIPEGWVVKPFSVFASNAKFPVKPEEIQDNDVYVGLEHIDRVCLSLTRWGTGSEVDSNKSGFLKNDILFGKLRPYFHKVAFAPSKGICSTDILVIRPNKETYLSLVAMQTFDPKFVEYANVRSTGTRMPRASWKDLSGYQLPSPNDELIGKFNAIVKPMLDSFSASVSESHCLSEVRDTLLPKLLSGELTLDPATTKEKAERETMGLSNA